MATSTTYVDSNDFKLNIIKDELKSFLSESTFHGFKRLSKNSHFSFKLVWFIFILFSISYCCIGIASYCESLVQRGIFITMGYGKPYFQKILKMLNVQGVLLTPNFLIS